MAAEASQAETSRQLTLNQDAGRIGEDHLSAMPCGGDPCGSVDIEADVRPTVDDAPAGVQADANPDRRAIRPLRRGERALRLRRSGHRRLRRREHREEGVSFGVDLDPVVRLDRLTHQGVMRGEQPRIAVAQRLE